jgi:hypothetical protein
MNIPPISGAGPGRRRFQHRAYDAARRDSVKPRPCFGVLAEVAPLPGDLEQGLAKPTIDRIQ